MNLDPTEKWDFFCLFQKPLENKKFRPPISGTFKI